MKHTTMAILAVGVVLVSSGLAGAAANFNQTFTNRTNQAAGGFNWWFSPDSTSSKLGSNVFTSTATTHVNPGTHGYTTEVLIHYSSGNVNVGNTATLWATLSNNSTVAFRTEWTNSLGVPIGSANLPFSLGGTYHVGIGNDRYWTMRIDNPHPDLVMAIDNLKYSASLVSLTGPDLQSFNGMWTAGPTRILVDPADAYEWNVPVSSSLEFPIVDATLSYDGDLDSLSEMRFQVTPEPATISLVLLGALGVITRRRRSAR